MAMPWSRAKQIRAEYLDGTRDRAKLTDLFDACFRIQREASEAAGRHIPMIVENVRGAQEWVGRSRWNFGSFHFWGDVPALMPIGHAVKVPGIDFNRRGESFNMTAQRRTNPGNGARLTSRDCGMEAGRKNGGDWFNSESPSAQRRAASGSKARKAAAARIAKIPFPVSQYLARHFKPEIV